MLLNIIRFKNVSLSGKTAIITGANEGDVYIYYVTDEYSAPPKADIKPYDVELRQLEVGKYLRGMGYQTAIYLASRNCRVIMACRKDAKEERDRIKKLTGNSNIELRYVNLESLSSVRHFAWEIVEREPRLDILINNAGIYSSKNRRTEDGLLRIMQVNHFGPFLLTYLLSGLLKKSAPSRIIFVASTVAFYNNLTIDNLNEPASRFFDMLTYGNSKLCNIISAKCFAEKLKQYNVVSNSVHPGLIQTRFLLKCDGGNRFVEWMEPVLSKMISLGTKDIEYGAKNITYAAIDEDVQKMTGQFFVNSRSHQPPVKVHDDIFCQLVWENSEYFVRLRPEERSVL